MFDMIKRGSAHNNPSYIKNNKDKFIVIVVTQTCSNDHHENSEYQIYLVKCTKNRWADYFLYWTRRMVCNNADTSAYDRILDIHMIRSHIWIFNETNVYLICYEIFNNTPELRGNDSNENALFVFESHWDIGVC